MITYLSTNHGIQDSLGHSFSSRNPTELLDFLLYSCSATHTLSELRAFWDLDASVSHILSLLPVPARKSLADTKRAVWPNYRLYYVPSKMFSVNKSHDEVTFYDLAQYFPDEPEPWTIQELQQKADQLLETLSDLGISKVARLTSPIAVAEGSELLGEYQTTTPTIYDTPMPCWEAYEYALQCTPREWVSNYQVGHWDNGELWDYDISSAYPFAASRLIDLRDCQFTKSDTMVNSAYYGFVYGDLFVDPSHPYVFCSPVVANVDGRLSNPVGHLPIDFYPLNLIRFIDYYQMGEFRLKLGWFISPYTAVRPRFPFYDLMHHLYSLRSHSPLASYFLKRVMNGIIGKLLETRKSDGEIVKYGDLYNPIYHAIITGSTKVRVAALIIENGITKEELVHVGIDGIKATRDLSIPSVTGMGKWRGASPRPTIITSPAGIFTPDRSHIPYPILRALLEAHPQSKRYSFDGWELDLSVLRARQSRSFAKLPRTGGALLENRYLSKPVEV